jgi:thioredoxin 1
MPDGDACVTLTEENFRAEVLESSQLVLVDFWAEWCMPCRAFSPILEDLADELAGTVRVGKLNIDEYPAIATQYKVRSIPTVLIFQKGELVDTIVGAIPKSILKRKVATLAAAP